MKVTNNNLYEVLYNLNPGETFVHEGLTYMMLSPSYCDNITKEIGNILSDGMKQRAAVWLSTGDIVIFDKYTHVYKKDFQVLEV
ncbi:MAG: hypothetical protein J6A25_00965 [Lachnospiraceae bacterium]|nr:hypothetical protein [Lachnospiraceae bacterium]